jgi:hypothetical protein
MDREPTEREPKQHRSSMEEVASRIDPQRLLPEVTFIKDDETGGDLPSESRSIIHVGEHVGVVTLEYNPDAKEAWFGTILIKQKKQGQGLGLATYKAVINEALENGYSFRTSPGLQTESGKKIWEGLAAAGVVRVEKEFTLDPLTDRYFGKYIIDAEQQSSSDASGWLDQVA